MTPKVKAQKTRLSNYLVNDLGAKVKKAINTKSEYFTLGNINIRISDHSSNKDDGYLNIYIPFNDPNIFIVENNYMISVLKSLKEIKTFIHAILFTDDMYRESYSLDIHKELVKSASESARLKAENSNLKEALSQEIKKGTPVREDSVTIDGHTYSISKCPNKFIDKIKNVISNCHLQEL